MTDKKIKIVIADDHKLVRQALKSLLEEQPKFKVIAEASHGAELLVLLETSRPDIVLLDIEMPVMNGLETMRVIRKRYPNLKVIMLSMHNEVTYMSEYITMGAKAYVPKGSDEETLSKAVYAVHKNNYYFDDETAAAVLKNLQNEKVVDSLIDNLVLSRREVQILKELCLGKTNREIADTLSVTTSTVSFHRANIYKKTQSRNIADLVKYSIRYGVVYVN